MTSPTYRLADHLLPEGVDRFVNGCRDDGMSWRKIALAVRDVTGGVVDVSGETIRSWTTEEDR